MWPTVVADVGKGTESAAHMTSERKIRISPSSKQFIYSLGKTVLIYTARRSNAIEFSYNDFLFHTHSVPLNRQYLITP